LIGQIPAPINDTGSEKRFNPNDSLRIVLHHEIALHNGLIVFMNQSLKETLADLKGTIIIDDTLEKIIRSVVGNRMPEVWHSLAFLSVLTLRVFIRDL
jgi:dynein heavy chain